MQQIAENVWILRYSLPLLGHDLGRVVTLIRLRSGKLVIHSTAPFSAEDVAAIGQLGEPTWLVDATLFHDSFAKEAQPAFPKLSYLAPRRFEEVATVETLPLAPAPNEWAGELEVIPLAGMPKVQEHVLFHLPSRTLIVCDFFFNFGVSGSAWRRFVVRHVMRLQKGIGMSLFFRLMIKDRAAFRESVRPILALNFDRIIVGHGDVIEADAQRMLGQELEARDLLPPVRVIE